MYLFDQEMVSVNTSELYQNKIVKVLFFCLVSNTIFFCENKVNMKISLFTVFVCVCIIVLWLMQFHKNYQTEALHLLNLAILKSELFY